MVSPCVRVFWATMASTNLILFGLSYLESNHQDNEQESQWCLSWLIELHKSTQSKIDVCYAWVHLLLQTNVFLKIKVLVLLADEFALVNENYIQYYGYKFIASFLSLSLSSRYCSATMFSEHLSHFHKTQVFKFIDILLKRLIYLISSFRNSEFQLTSPNTFSTAPSYTLPSYCLVYTLAHDAMALLKFLYFFLLCLFFSISTYQNSNQTSNPDSMPSSP